MIIGRGLIASALRGIEGEKQVIFASGVSNSQETNEKEFDRERSLLEKSLLSINDFELFYISTCSIYDPSLVNARYIRHKLLMEEIVLSQPNCRIVRLPNVVGPTGNPNNLVNFFANRIKTDTPFKIQRNAARYILGVDEMRALLAGYLDASELYDSLINITPPTATHVLELVQMIEQHLSKDARKLIIDGGSTYTIPNDVSSSLSGRLGIYFGQEYTMSVVEKWVSHA